MLNRINRIYIMMFLNASFFVIEIVIGYYVSSLALIADSFHMLNDVLSLLVALWAIRLSDRPHQHTSKYSYGWQRAEILGALLNGVFLLALCFTILMEAIQRFIHMEPMSNPEMVLITGGAGLLANILGLFLFHEHGHGHGHTHDHTNDNRNNAKTLYHHQQQHDYHTDLEETHYTHNHHHHHHIDGGHLNMKGIFLHVLGDALGNIGVMAAALFIWLTPYSWRFYVDPAISLVIAIIIFASAIPLVKATSFILLQGVPQNIDLDKVRDCLLQIPSVLSLHELHIWQLNDSKCVASLHVLMKEADYMQVSTQMRQALHEFGIHSATIQPEFLDTDKKMASASTLSINSKCSTTIQASDTLLEYQDSSVCLLHCIDSDSCYEQACCSPPYIQLPAPDSPNH